MFAGFISVNAYTALIFCTCRHRMTKGGRREAARTAEVAYRLYDSLYTKRFVTLAKLSEKVKLAGLGASEASRMRQYERWMGDAIEQLRMVKTYRTPQTLRSFARLFTTLLPPFFAPAYAQLAVNLDSLALGITFAVVTSLCLNALLEGVEIVSLFLFGDGLKNHIFCIVVYSSHLIEV